MKRQTGTVRPGRQTVAGGTNWNVTHKVDYLPNDITFHIKYDISPPRRSINHRNDASKRLCCSLKSTLPTLMGIQIKEKCSKYLSSPHRLSKCPFITHHISIYTYSICGFQAKLTFYKTEKHTERFFLWEKKSHCYLNIYPWKVKIHCTQCVHITAVDSNSSFHRAGC